MPEGMISGSPRHLVATNTAKIVANVLYTFPAQT